MSDKIRVAVITGATGGLGRVVTRLFLEADYRVMINYRKEEKFQAMKKEFPANTPLEGMAADVTREEEVKQFFEAIWKKFGRLDVFIHLTGGFWMGGGVDETPLQEWQKMLDMNLLTTFLCTREAMRWMKKQKHGKIFTVASRTALELPAGMGAYSVSKAAVLALTEVLAKEGKPFNITANSLLPSIIDTEANRRAMPGADYSTWVTPEQIGCLLVSLSDEVGTPLSGTALKVYGKV